MILNKLHLCPIILILLCLTNNAHTQIIYGVNTSVAGTCTAIPNTGEEPIFISLTDDQFTGSIALPFTFDFFENSYTDFFISSNGKIRFGSGSADFTNDSLPSTNIPNNYIAFFWDDIDPGIGGTISHFPTTFNGQTCYAIDYSNIPHFSSPTFFVTGQIIICADASITLNCIDCQVDGNDNPPSATQGIENIDGTQAYFNSALTDGVTSTDLQGCVTLRPFTTEAIPICQLGDEDNFYVDIIVTSIGPNETAFIVNDGAFPNITAIGTYTIGPFPSEMTTIITLEGQVTGSVISYTEGLDCSCIAEAVETNEDSNICLTEEANLEAILGDVILIDGYRIITPTGDCTVIPEGTATFETLDDDDSVGPIPLPFTFEFFDNPYSDFHINSNGFISFGSGSLEWSNDPLPSLGLPHNFIALFWDDLNPFAGGTISHFNTTFNGQACYAIEYNGIPPFGDNSITTTGQIILCPNGAITINCIDCQTINGTQGIENIDGTAAYFDPILIDGLSNPALQNCVTFDPNPLSCDFVAWATDLNDVAGTTVSTDLSTTVSPTETTTYYAIVDCSNGPKCFEEVVVSVNAPTLDCPNLSLSRCNNPITDLNPMPIGGVFSGDFSTLIDANGMLDLSNISEYTSAGTYTLTYTTIAPVTGCSSSVDCSFELETVVNDANGGRF